MWLYKLNNSSAIKIHLKQIMLLMQWTRLWGKKEMVKRREILRGRKRRKKKRKKKRHGKEKWCSRQFNVPERKENFHILNRFSSHPASHNLQLRWDAAPKPSYSMLKEGTTEGIKVIQVLFINTEVFISFVYQGKQLDHFPQSPHATNSL